LADLLSNSPVQRSPRSTQHARPDGPEFLAVRGAEPSLCGLLRNLRKTECGAIGSWIGWVRAAPFALLGNSPAHRSLARQKLPEFPAVRGAEPALHGLLRNSRKTECGAIGSWIGLGVRAAPFALLRNSLGQRSLAQQKLPEFPTVRSAEPARRGLDRARRLTAFSRCRIALILLVLAVSLRAEDQASRVFHEGQKAERAGDILQAYVLYARAALLDPSNLAIAAHRNQAATRAMQTAQIHDVNTDPDPEGAFFQLIASEGPGQIDTFGAAAMPTHLVSAAGTRRFDLRGDAKSNFQQVGEAFGIQMLFEPDYQGPAAFPFRTGELSMAETLRILEAMTNSLVEPVNERTALVIRDTAQHRAEMNPAMSATIQIPERMAVQDAQEIVTAVQQTLEIRRIQVDPGRRQVIIRDSVGKVLLARKLFSELSRLRAQVEVEVQLLTVTKDSSLEIGLTLPNSASIVNFGNFLQNAISAAGFSSFLTFGGGKTLFGLGVASAQLFATLTNSDADSLLTAQMVALDGQAASLNVGERYPIATAQYMGATGPTLTTPTPTVTYEDIGLVLKVTPTVHDANEMSLDIDAAFTTLGATAAGSNIPAIAQRKFQGKVRLHEGEWAVVAGLAQTTDSINTSGILGLASIPILGRLFRTDSTEKDSDQTLLVLKPRLINLPPWEIPVSTVQVGSEGRPISIY
jgi:general secretion pathway protein D